MLDHSALAPDPSPDGSARAGSLIAALFTLSMCHGERAPSSSASAPPPPLPSATSLATPSATAPVAEVPSAAEPDAGAAPAAPVELGEPVVDRRIFREMLVGALPWGERRTWVLSRGNTRAKLAVACQVRAKEATTKGKGYMALDGHENDASRWLPASVVEYVGPQSGKLSYRLAAPSKPAGDCRRLPDVILLSCRNAPVPVLHAGAALVLHNGGKSDEVPASHWQPATLESVPSLRCTPSAEDDGGTHDITFWHDEDVVFAAGKRGAPGVEFVFENSDMVVQTGAYRWMPAEDDPAALPR